MARGGRAGKIYCLIIRYAGSGLGLVKIWCAVVRL